MIITQSANRYQMRSGEIFSAFIVMALLLFFTPGLLYALQLNVGATAAAPGDNVSVDIIVEQYTDELLAGAAFTLSYDTDQLTLAGVESDFFDLFTNQWNALNPVPNPLPPTSVDVDGQTYTRPLIESTTTATPTGKTLLAGIRVQGGQPSTLFTLSFAVNAVAPPGKYDIDITPTNLNNAAAGYDPAGENVPMLVGLGSGSNPYPSYSPTRVNGSVTVVLGLVDTDNDGIDDDWEKTHFENDLTIANEFTDWDGDWYSDRQEYINYTNGETDPNGQAYDPKVVNAVGGTGYVQKYSVGGSVSGLVSGNSITLQNNSGDNLSIAGPGGSFIFTEKLLEGSSYDVTVVSQPAAPRQNCTVSGGTGIIAQADVTDVTVVCVNTYTVGGSVSGLASGSSFGLQNNSGDDLLINSDGSFTFATALVDGSSYAVTVLTQPNIPAQVCTVSNGTGAIDKADVAGIAIACVNTYTVGGSVSGLASGNSFVLQNNGGNDLLINSDGSFTFATALADGSSYGVAVLQQPVSPNQICSISWGTGTGSISQTDVTDVAIVCVTNKYTFGGSVSGLVHGNSFVLQNNSGDDLVINSGGSFTFATALTDESPYEVMVLQQPLSPDQICEVSNASGTLAGEDVTDIEVLCEVNTFPWHMFLPAFIGNSQP